MDVRYSYQSFGDLMEEVDREEAAIMSDLRRQAFVRKTRLLEDEDEWYQYE